MNNFFDLKSWRWRRLQEINQEIEQLQKEREQISKNLDTIGIPRTPIVEPLIDVKPTWNDGLGNVPPNYKVPSSWTVKPSPKEPIAVPPKLGEDTDNSWGWIIAIVIGFLIFASLG